MILVARENRNLSTLSGSPRERLRPKLSCDKTTFVVSKRDQDCINRRIVIERQSAENAWSVYVFIPNSLKNRHAGLLY
jgi:hypothetical protein